MENKQWHILSTRPLSPALIEEATTAAIRIDTLSFIETEPVHSDEVREKIKDLTGKTGTVVFTSMNAVEAVKPYIKHQPDWRIYCIGHTTQQLAAALLGKDRIAGTAADAAQLAQTIINDGVRHIHFFCGNIRRDEMPALLQQHQVVVEEIIVYVTKETPHPINTVYDGILFYSPSAVKSFFGVNTPDPGTTYFAIGSTTGTAIQQYGIKNVIIAEVPGKEALARLAITHFRTQKA